MGKLVDLIGKTFGRLTVKERGPNNKFNKSTWWCECSCGNPNLVLKNGNDLSGGKTKSCGCLIHDRPKKIKIKQKTIKEIQAEERTGMELYNNSGDLMKIIQYQDSEHVLIEFQDQYKYHMWVLYSNFKKGTVKNPYHKGLYGLGYIGVGDYVPSINRQATPIYDAWRKMFDRCYGENQEEAYKGCTVCEEWFNFQNFAKWYEEHYWKDPNYSMHIDKDWLEFGNKIYTPDKCEIVPFIINTCGLRHDKTTYKNLPANIHLTASNKYKPRLSKYGQRVELGTYDDLEEAMRVYKTEKIKYVQEIANKYRDKISDKLYNVMMNYEERLIQECPEYAKI